MVCIHILHSYFKISMDYIQTLAIPEWLNTHTSDLLSMNMESRQFLNTRKAVCYKDILLSIHTSPVLYRVWLTKHHIQTLGVITVNDILNPSTQTHKDFNTLYDFPCRQQWTILRHSMWQNGWMICVNEWYFDHICFAYLTIVTIQMIHRETHPPIPHQFVIFKWKTASLWGQMHHYFATLCRKIMIMQFQYTTICVFLSHFEVW